VHVGHRSQDVLSTADSGLTSFTVQKGQLPLPTLLDSTLATVLCLERLVVGSQLADVVDCATEDGDLRDPAITASAWYHVAQAVEVAFEVVATLALHHIVLSSFMPLILM